MELLSGADMVIRALEAEGVEYVFGYPGASIQAIYEALHSQNVIEAILVRHEQAAAHAADGYARATGKPGVVLVTSGPGGTNIVTGLAAAYTDSVPLVVLSGQVPVEMIGTDACQETDMVGVSRPIVKHSFLVRRTEDLPSVIQKAFYIAATGRPGPVLIDIPQDLIDPTKKLQFNYPKKVKLRSYTPPQKGHTGQIKRAVDLLLSAERPVLMCGGGVIMGEGTDLVKEMVDLINYPVAMTLMGLGAFPSNHTNSLGMLGVYGHYEANMAIHHSDVILAIGTRFDDHVTKIATRFAPSARIIHIDIDPASIAKTIMPDIPIVGPVSSVLSEVVSLIKEKLRNKKWTPNLTVHEKWWQQVNKWREAASSEESLPQEEPGELIDSDQFISPIEVISEVNRLTGSSAFVTTDVGQHQMVAARNYKFDLPRRWLTSGGLGAMGYGLPAAIGVQLAHRDSSVVVVTSDGSLQMSLAELSTCKQYQLPIKVLHLNNRSLGMMHEGQINAYEGPNSKAYRSSLPDFIKLVEAYGHETIAVSTPAELVPALERGFAIKDKLVFWDIRINPSTFVQPSRISQGDLEDLIFRMPWAT